MSNKKKTSNKDKAEEKQKLLNDLYVATIGLDSLLAVFIAILISIQYVNWKRIKILDDINNTDYSANIPDLSQLPKQSTNIYLATAYMYVFTSHYYYNVEINKSESEKDEKQIDLTYSYLINSIVLFIIAVINYNLVYSSD